MILNTSEFLSEKCNCFLLLFTPSNALGPAHTLLRSYWGTTWRPHNSHSDGDKARLYE